MDLLKMAFKQKYRKVNIINFSKILIVLIILQFKPVLAKDYINERAYFEDKTGTMSLQEVKNKDFIKIDSVLSKGYSKSVFWLRLKVSPLVGTNFRNLLLKIQPSYVDSIQLLDSADPSNTKRILGTNFSSNNNDYSSINFNFVIPGSEKERYVYLKIQTQGTYFIRTEAVTISEFINGDLVQQIVFAFYIGVLCFLFIFPLTIWIRDKDKLNIIFVIKQFAAIVFVVMDTGIQRVIFKNTDPLLLNVLFNFNVVTYTAILIGFHYFFLKDYYPKSWVKYLFLILLIFYVLEIYEIDGHNFRDSLEINSIVLTLVALSFFVIPFFGLSWEKNKNPMFTKKSIIIIYFSIAISILLTTIPSLGYINGNSFSRIPNLFTGCITGIVFLFVLQYRNRMFREQGVREIAQANAMVEFERNKRQEKERFISMLTHELKTPLSVLKLAYESGNATASDKNVHGALKDINDVIDRCALEDKLENQGFNLLIEKHNLKRIIYQKISEYDSVDKFKFTIDGDLSIESDLNILRIILGNLFDNAIKYGDENSPILVKAILQAQKIYLTVTNTVSQVGLPDEDKIFTKYYRSEKAYKNTGSGLGLYLVSNLAKLLKGEVKYYVNSKQDQVTFEIILPEKM
jgi:two-component system, sensor histidine kinase LadS